MSEKDANQLLAEGLAALEVGDKRHASDLLKQAVEENPELLEAWLALAPILDDKDEKRIALTTILQLEPGNEYAKTELLATEKAVSESAAEAEIVPGITRREARWVGIGLGIYTVVVCLLVFLITSSINGQRAAQQAQLEREIANLTATKDAELLNATATAAELTEEATVMAATIFAQSSPTPTGTPTRSRELPTPIPPTPTPTSVVLRALSEPPNYLVGRIFARGGRNPSSDEFLTLRIYPAGGGGTFTEISSELVQFPVADNNGERLIYAKYRRDDEWSLASLNPSASASEPTIYTLRLPDGTTVTNPISPSISADGTKVAVISLNFQTNRHLVYLIDMTTNAVTLLTPPDGNYESVAISSDGSKVAAVRNDGTATDIVLINTLDAANNYPRTPLTTDGNTITEAMLDFSVDGATLVFSGNDGTNTDLYLLRLNGTAPAGTEKLNTATLAATEVYPVFSPDGRYLVYSANPTGASEIRPDGVMNLFIYELGVGNTYQLTAEDESVYPGSWSN